MADHATSILQKELSLLSYKCRFVFVVDTIPALSYCHAFAADPDTALLELSIRQKCNDFCLLCHWTFICLSLPSRTRDASSPTHYTAAARQLMFFLPRFF